MDSIKTKKWSKQRQSEYYKEWRKTNKKHLAEYKKNWDSENPNYNSQYYENNKEEILQNNKNWREEHPEQVKKNWDKWYQMNKTRSPKRRFTEAKHSAKKRKIEWNLTLEEYTELIATPCYYCNNRLCEPVKRSVGLDRLDSNKGYEISNVVSCGYMCNCIKHMFLTPEEMKLVAKTLIEFRSQKKLNDGELIR